MIDDSEIYCPLCSGVMLDNDETKKTPIGEKAHKECVEKIIAKI